MTEEVKSRGGRPLGDKVVYGEFAKRLQQATENNPNFPPLYHGLYIVVQKMLEKKGLKVVRETIRKWFHGETMPPPGRIEVLAEVLSVDPAWLHWGDDVAKTSATRVTQSRDASAVTNIVAGLIALDGGHPAFPQGDDERAEEDGIDLHAVIRGAKYAFRIAMGEPKGDDVVFTWKQTSVLVLGVVREGFGFRIFEITEHKQDSKRSTSGLQSISLTMDQLEQAEITTFEKRI